MDTIRVKCKEPPKQLGDCIDMVLYCHMLSVVENKEVNLEINSNSRIDYFNSLISIGGKVSVNNSNKGVYTLEYRSGLDGASQYLLISTQVDNIKTSVIPENCIVRIPKKFVTVQWDAAQKYRLLDKERIITIEQFYKDQGYDIVDIGHKLYSLQATSYILSQADYHVGVDSGMAHIAKLILPMDRLHLYVNTRNRENDKRFPDSIDVAWMAREMFRRGAKMNFCENPSQEQIDYFKDSSIWLGLVSSI